jgi:transposase
MTRYGLRDDQWERIKDLLPGKLGDVGATARDNRRFVEAVLYRYRAGIPWRDLPERFGAWKNTHQRFSRWAKTGVWERVFEHLAVDGNNEYAMIDSTIVAGSSIQRRRSQKKLRTRHLAAAAAV